MTAVRYTYVVRWDDIEYSGGPPYRQTSDWWGGVGFGWTDYPSRAHVYDRKEDAHTAARGIRIAMAAECLGDASIRVYRRRAR